MKVSKHDTKININEDEVIPIENAICNNIDYKNLKPLIIENTQETEFSEAVNATIKNNTIDSYLGVPIVFKDGKRFGALCAAHHNSSQFDQNDVKLLEKIANLFTYYLELERQAFKDALTGLENTHFLKIKSDDIIKYGGILIMLDLDNFKLINDTLGHYVGDLVLKELGTKLITFAKKFEYYHLIRTGGDEFLLYIKDQIDSKNIPLLLTELSETLSVWEVDIKEVNLTSSIGACKFSSNISIDFKTLYQKTDDLLYQAKEQGKNCFVYDVETLT